jgi:transcriptional regulator with GAF, ATPase, and Fis domain
MDPEGGALSKKVEDFLSVFRKGEEFTQELLRQNETLRYKIARLESSARMPVSDSGNRLDDLAKRLQELEEENRALLDKFRQAEEENKDFANRYVEVEMENNNLANLYVASYQLHSTLDFSESLKIILEIVMNLIGAEEFSIMLLDEKTNELSVVAHEGMGPKAHPGIRIGSGIIGASVKTGEAYYRKDDLASLVDVDYEHPLICIPLKIKEHVIGAIVIYKLLEQKKELTAVDYELISMLAGHAATAVFSSQLYSHSERKLSTIQSFLDLLKDKTSPSP